ncbi:MAG: glycosyltransferase [Thermosynechococcaceae cyanobacterium]
MAPNPAVALFCGRLLPASETFIPMQGEGLKQFTPYYIGTRFVDGISLPPERTHVVNSGGIIGTCAEVLFKQWGTSPKLVRYLQQLNPALVHAHFGVCGTLALPLVTALNLPLIVTFHGLDATMTDQYARRHSLSTRVYLRRREALKRRAQCFICVSEFIKAQLLTQGFPADKLRVHYIGVDAHILSPDPSIVREPIILFVGRLVEKKGCEYLIRAMAQVRVNYPEVKLVIIGDGPLRQALETLATKTLKHYQFLGMQPSARVRDWMMRSHLLIVPSVTSAVGDSEGLPTVILEAQAMGLPVVASQHGGIPEAVMHRETGLLVPERNWQSLAQQIENLLQPSSDWQRFSINGQQQVRRKFNLHQQIQNLERIYHRVKEQEF